VILERRHEDSVAGGEQSAEREVESQPSRGSKQAVASRPSGQSRFDLSFKALTHGLSHHQKRGGRGKLTRAPAATASHSGQKTRYPSMADEVWRTQWFERTTKLSESTDAKGAYARSLGTCVLCSRHGAVFTNSGGGHFADGWPFPISRQL